MAVASAQVAVTTAGARLIAPIPNGQSAVIVNRAASASVFVGPRGVSSSTGLEVTAGTPLSGSAVALPPETEVWAVSASGTARVDVLQVEAL